jgi:hypothetical protein
MRGTVTAVATAMLCVSPAACFSSVPPAQVDSGQSDAGSGPDGASPDAGAPDATLAMDAGTPRDATGEASQDAGSLADADSPADVVDAAVTCAQWDAAIELDGGPGDGATSINAEGGALPGPPPTACSLLGDIHAPLQVTNNSPCPIEMWWVDYNCQEQSYGIVGPSGGSWSNDTWDTNPWRIRLVGSEQLLLEIPPVPEGVDASLRTISYP